MATAPTARPRLADRNLEVGEGGCEVEGEGFEELESDLLLRGARGRSWAPSRSSCRREAIAFEAFVRRRDPRLEVDCDGESRWGIGRWWR